MSPPYTGRNNPSTLIPQNQISEAELKKGNTFYSSGQTSNSRDWEIYELNISKRHAVSFQIAYFTKIVGGGGGAGGLLFLVTGGGGVSVIPSMIRFFTKKWENCICSFVLSPFLEKRNGNLFPPIVRGWGPGRGLLNLWKFADTSGLTLLGVVTIEVHVRLGCLCQVFQFFISFLALALMRYIGYHSGLVILLLQL